MPTPSEYNQFRRLVGDYNTSEINQASVDTYLDDAVRELTADFVSSTGAPAPVTDFDSLVNQYKPEVIVWAAIQYWWDQAAKFAGRHSQSVGQASQAASEKFERAMRMIEMLRMEYDKVQQLGTDITFGNISRFSRLHLTRIGGRREETVIEEEYGN